MSNFHRSSHDTNSCYSIGQSVRSPEALIGQGSCKRTNLHIIRNGTLIGRQYRDEILGPIVVSYAAIIGDDYMLMDEN
ncbi:hypothetical protein TNCV_2089291 [Trichonephila clavipes]|nr:hypothetical protein TNCV_2089291 [Trichonephila clavipes]